MKALIRGEGRELARTELGLVEMYGFEKGTVYADGCYDERGYGRLASGEEIAIDIYADGDYRAYRLLENGMLGERL